MTEKWREVCGRDWATWPGFCQREASASLFSPLGIVSVFSSLTHGVEDLERSITAQHVKIIWCHDHNTGIRVERRDKAKVSIECVSLGGLFWGVQICLMLIHGVMQCTFRHTIVLEEIFFLFLETKLRVHRDPIWVVHLQCGFRILHQFVLCACMLYAWDWHLV